MTGERKQLLVVGAGAVGIYLVYRYQHNNAASQQAGTQTGGVDPTAASDYAALAGQQQSDVAALQQQNSQLMATEQSDVQNLSTAQQALGSDFGAFQAQETSDVQSLTGQIAASVSQATQAALQAVGPSVAKVNQQAASIAAGQTAVSRSIKSLTTDVNLRFLAPGAHNPTFVLVPPKNAPASARWSGKTKPKGKWRGIGGGWWVPVRK